MAAISGISNETSFKSEKELEKEIKRRQELLRMNKYTKIEREILKKLWDHFMEKKEKAINDIFRYFKPNKAQKLEKINYFLDEIEKALNYQEKPPIKLSKYRVKVVKGQKSDAPRN